MYTSTKPLYTELETITIYHWANFAISLEVYSILPDGNGKLEDIKKEKHATHEREDDAENDHYDSKLKYN